MNAYYAYDPDYAADLAEQMVQALNRREHQSEDSHAYLMLDCIFHPELGEQLWQKRETLPIISLYQGSRKETVEGLSPFLYQLPVTPLGRRRELDHWLAQCRGKPMLSLLSSSLPLTVLQEHMRGFMDVRTRDGLLFTLRYTDSRTSATCLESVGAEARQSWLNGVYDWWVIGREGGLKRLGGAQTATLQAAAPPASGAYELNDYRY
ncbi:DUF4123 domain-containing protein, partial [Neisseriaceae bacterium TC5R-5]|nr:DUF4123 domain-containing protein [Neisseriaceae bacterium TC5R-5]